MTNKARAHRKTQARPSTGLDQAALRLSRCVVRPNLVTLHNDDKTIVVVDPQQERLFSIDGFAAQLWDIMVNEPKADVVRSRMSHYRGKDCSAQIDSLLNDLGALGLIKEKSIH